MISYMTTRTCACNFTESFSVIVFADRLCIFSFFSKSFHIIVPLKKHCNYSLRHKIITSLVKNI